jgi:hypothetical protein
VNAPAAARTYRIGGIQPYLMLLVLAACTAFSPFVLTHAISNRSWLELGWAAVVIWIFGGTVWRAAYRIDLQNELVEFRGLLWRQVVPLRHVKWIRCGHGFAVVRLRRGTVHVYGAVEGWDDFISRARRANARLRVFRTGPRRR